MRGLEGRNFLDASDDIQHLVALKYIASVSTNQAPIQKHDAENQAYPQPSREQ